MPNNPRAGSPPAPRTSSTSPRLVTAYYDRHPDPADPSSGSRSAPRGTAARRCRRPFNEDHIAATSQAICEYRAAQGTDGPLFLGARHPRAVRARAGSPRWRCSPPTTCTVLVDSARRLHPDPGRLARDPHRTTAAAPAGSPTASSSPRRTTRRATAASSTTRPTAARPTPTPPAGSQDRANELLAAGLDGRPAASRYDAARAPTHRPLRLPRRLRRRPADRRSTWTRSGRPGVRIGADPLGGASVGLLGRDRRAATASTSPW